MIDAKYSTSSQSYFYHILGWLIDVDCDVLLIVERLTEKNIQLDVVMFLKLKS